MKRIREFGSVEDRIEPFLKSLRKKEGINTHICAIIKRPEGAQKGSPLFLDMVEDAKILFGRWSGDKGTATRPVSFSVKR